VFTLSGTSSTITTTTILQPFFRDYLGEPAVRHQKKHSPTHTYPDYQPSFVSFLHLLCSIASSLFNLGAWQSFLHNLSPSPLWFTSRSGTLHRPRHALYISSPNHCLLFATNAHTIATCFVVVPILCHLILVSLSSLLETLWYIYQKSNSMHSKIQFILKLMNV